MCEKEWNKPLIQGRLSDLVNHCDPICDCWVSFQVYIALHHSGSYIKPGMRVPVSDEDWRFLYRNVTLISPQCGRREILHGDEKGA